VKGEESEGRSMDRLNAHSVCVQIPADGREM